MHVSTLVWILQHGQVNLWIVSHGQAYLTVNIITVKFSDSTGITCKTWKRQGETTCQGGLQTISLLAIAENKGETQQTRASKA